MHICPYPPLAAADGSCMLLGEPGFGICEPAAISIYDPIWSYATLQKPVTVYSVRMRKAAHMRNRNISRHPCHEACIELNPMPGRATRPGRRQVMRTLQAQFREGLGAPELLLRTPDGVLAPLSGPVPLPEVPAGAARSVVLHMSVPRLGQLQLAAQLTCTLIDARFSSSTKSKFAASRLRCMQCSSACTMFCLPMQSCSKPHPC